MSMENIVISSLKGIKKTIAKLCDKDGNGVLENGKYSEISIFNQVCETISSNEDSFVYKGQRYKSDGSIDINVQMEALADNTRVAPTAKEMYKANTIAKDANKAYFAKDPQYQKIHKIAESQVLRRIPPANKNRKFSDIKDSEERAKYEKLADKVTNMVLKACKKYQIEDLGPVIADMLGAETGGYVFTDKVLRNPGKSYKGVLQVDLETCCSIYGTSCKPVSDGQRTFTPKYRGKQGNDAYSYWHKRHFSQDDVRIDELKKKYPTPDALFKAIQKDPELGLEVGIIAFKAKLSEANGSVSGAVRRYCGNQYRCDIPGVPSNYDVKA